MTIPTEGLFASLASEKDTILAQAVAGAKQRGTVVTADMVKEEAAAVAKTTLRDRLVPMCKSTLDVGVTMFGFTVGERPKDTPMDDPEYAQWRDQFDEHMMDAIGRDALKLAGQDFIGEYLTDSELDDETIRKSAAAKMAANIVVSAAGDRLPGQLLAEVGITAEDLTGAVPAGGAPLTAEPPMIREDVARAHVERLVGQHAIANAVYDAEALSEVLKIAFDDDPFLPLGAIEQLGGTQADQPYFAAYFKAAGAEAVANTAQAAIMAALTGQLVEMPKDAPKGKKPQGGKKSDTPGPATTVVAPPPPVVPAVENDDDGIAKPLPEGDIDVTEVLRLMLEHGSDGQAELGELVGKSRGHINNVKNGKTTQTATLPQRKRLVTRLQLRIEGLQTALARLT